MVYLWLTSIRELDNLVRGSKKLTRLGPRTERLARRSHLRGLLVIWHLGLVIFMVRLGHQQHTTDKISGRNTLGSLDLPVPLGLFDAVVRVQTVRIERDVVTMDAKVALVLVKRLERRVIGRVLDDLVDPLDAAHHFVALGLIEDRRALVLGDLGVRVDTDHKVIA